MKNIISSILLIIAFITCSLGLYMAAKNSSRTEQSYTVSYAVFEKQFIQEELNYTDNFLIYDTSELTVEILQNRTSDVVIVERCLGVVTNAVDVGDGQVLNTDDSYYNYICYAGLDGVKKGDIILTYFVYNPQNTYIDDTIERCDYFLRH